MSECQLTIYTGLNDQTVQINGLTNAAGAAVTGATISGVLNRANSPLPSGTITFADVASQAGNYSGVLTGFNSTAGPAVLVVTGIASGVNFGFSVNVNVVNRVL